MMEAGNSEKEDIVIIGYGWVGQANALALSRMGYTVCYYDKGEPTLRYKKDSRGHYDRIRRLSSPLERDGVNTTYVVSVGDRVSEEGVQDITFIEQALSVLREAKGVVVLRSTVLPEHLPGLPFDYYLPEFLHEQYAVDECLYPFLFVVGKGETERNEPAFFKKWEHRAAKKFHGDAREASYIKYLSNIWNALRISFTNEMGDLISLDGAEPKTASRVIDFLFDQKSYLRYGKAYGGHCLPKDTLAFWKSHSILEGRAGLVRAIHDSNDRHKSLSGYQNLPEWFSKWEWSGSVQAGISHLWQKFNSMSIIRAVRRTLRPVRLFWNKLLPERSLASTGRIWNSLGKQKPLYYSHPGTKSGRRVAEYEFREGGKREYDHFITQDKEVLKRLRDRTQKTALDLGIGAGRHAEFFANDFKELIGVDIAEEMLSVAQRRLGEFFNIKLVPTSGDVIPVPDTSVDFIFSRETLQSVREWRILESYAKEMYRTLRSGGLIKVELRTGRMPYRGLYSYGLSVTEEEARLLFESVGFIMLSVVSEGTKHLWVTAVKE